MSQRRGFTLIELLVVISIVGLLSSVVLASLNSARDKGRMAAGRQFEANMYHAEADQAVGIWDFDECSGSTTADRTGFGGTGTLTGGVSWSTNTPTGTGCSLSFDGSTGYVNVADNAGLEIGTSDLTVAAWVKTTTASIMGVAGHVSGVGYSLRLTALGGAVFGIGSGGVGGVNTTVVMNDGKWHFVAGIASRGGTGYVCIDGTCNAPTSVVTSVDLTNGAALTIGQTAAGFFNGQIDGVRVYAKSFTASEIGKLYASEAPRFKVAEK